MNEEKSRDLTYTGDVHRDKHNFMSPLVKKPSAMGQSAASNQGGDMRSPKAASEFIDQQMQEL